MAFPGMMPPQKARSTQLTPEAKSCFFSSPCIVVVGGIELSGMSTRVVIPPKAAARVAVSKPSQCVLPGSLMCTWLSTIPGRIWISN